MDATGAGDAFAAGLLATLDPADASYAAAVERAMQAGHRASAVIVGRLAQVRRV